jgi:hypothetical protein
MAISEEVIRKVLNKVLMTEEVKKAQECSDCLSKTIERLIEIMKDPEEQAKLRKEALTARFNKYAPEDGEMRRSDGGLYCYWDDQEKRWIMYERDASPRFLAVVVKRDDFEGFEDPDISDEEEEADD